MPPLPKKTPIATSKHVIREKGRKVGLALRKSFGKLSKFKLAIKRRTTNIGFRGKAPERGKAGAWRRQRTIKTQTLARPELGPAAAKKVESVRYRMASLLEQLG